MSAKPSASRAGRAAYVVGIDLGTTHCALAYSPVGSEALALFEVPQLVAPGEVAPRALLPSFLYLPAPGELSEPQRSLPWGVEPRVVGHLARVQGARVPNRLVASAKSWICHGGINRRAPVLPWGTPDEEPHVSPFETQALYLAHLRAAWDHAHPDAPLAQQDVVVTVPASFDEVARELTKDAARVAGLPEVRLLEEPQAALYDFIGAHREVLDTVLKDARLVLVVDVGGGTTDLTLVRVRPGDEGPEIERIAVGGHLVLGGDNMDAALAMHLQEAAGIAKLDATEWSALVQAARVAKEQLLAEDAPESVRVAIQRRGARLIGGTKTVELDQDTARAILIDGFIPVTSPDEQAERNDARAGLTTLGLPYATDPAIPRHVNSFLRRHAVSAEDAGAQVTDGLPRPDLILLNGGVFNAPALVKRLNGVLSFWYGEPPRRLDHTSLDTAVARGAARFALARRGFGKVITGGSARAYYIGVEGKGGVPQAFCAAPKGMDEGSSVDVKDQLFQLMLGRPVSFPIYGYTGARVDPPGTIVPVDAELDPLPPLQTTLKSEERGTVPVTLRARLNETGSLGLSLGSLELPPRHWRLEFALRGEAQPEAPPPTEVELGALPREYDQARRFLARVYSKKGEDPKLAKGLRRELEGVLGSRGEWPVSVCRALWKAAVAGREFRGRTPKHELTWVRLVGWCLRPGFGVVGDAGRMRETWALFGEGLQNPRDKATKAEWWIMWRRIAAGLDATQQAAVYAEARKEIQPGRTKGLAEVLRLIAALERLPAEQKEEAGGLVLERAEKLRAWWSLGRIGSRAPFRGERRDVVPVPVAEAWLRRVLELDWATAEGASFAAVMLARRTGDARDVDARLRAEVVARLEAAKASPRWIDLVETAGDLSAGDAKRVFGDALPAGLRLG